MSVCMKCGIPSDSYCHRLSTSCPTIPVKKYEGLWDIWYMESETYESYLQWLPKEMLEDTILLVGSDITFIPCYNMCYYGSPRIYIYKFSTVFDDSE